MLPKSYSKLEVLCENFEVNVLDFCNLARNAWNEVPSLKFSNCSKTSDFVINSQPTEVDEPKEALTIRKIYYRAKEMMVVDVDKNVLTTMIFKTNKRKQRRQ